MWLYIIMLMDFLKKIKIQFFLFLSVLILFSLLLIQVRWMNKALNFSENKFKYKVGIAIDATILELEKENSRCEIIDECLYNSSDFMFPSIMQDRLGKLGKLDSIFQEKLKLQHIKSTYTLDLLSKAISNRQGYCFNYNINRLAFDDKPAVLNVSFQNKRNTIIYSMKMLFVCSLVLIFLLCIVFFITLVCLLKEKKIQGQTIDLINNITHEFKTPMATIALAGSMLNKDRISCSPEQVKYYASIIRSENARLSMQVDQLLKLDSIEKGELSFSPEPIELKQLINGVCESSRVRFNVASDLNNNLNTDKVYVLADFLLLENVFINIIDNAIKYSEDNPVVDIDSYKTKNSIFIKIKDRGIGISKDNQEFIYNKYYRVTSGDLHDVKGFGIGLSYVKEVVNLHGGKILLESKLKEGSTFTIELPLL